MSAASPHHLDSLHILGTSSPTKAAKARGVPPERHAKCFDAWDVASKPTMEASKQTAAPFRQFGVFCFLISLKVFYGFWISGLHQQALANRTMTRPKRCRAHRQHHHPPSPKTQKRTQQEEAGANIAQKTKIWTCSRQHRCSWSCKPMQICHLEHSANWDLHGAPAKAWVKAVDVFSISPRSCHPPFAKIPMNPLCQKIKHLPFCYTVHHLWVCLICFWLYHSSRFRPQLLD